MTPVKTRKTCSFVSDMSNQRLKSDEMKVAAP